MSKCPPENPAIKREQFGLRKQIISIFSIVGDEMGPHVESFASPYSTESLFNEREISILYTAVTMLDIREMITGEFKLIFENYDFKLVDQRTSKRVIVTVCGCEANSGQIRTMVRELIHSSDQAIRNLGALHKR